MSRLGFVLIGRNEGDRLVRCLASVQGRGQDVVYVDSGSSDGSVALARTKGASVVELDAATPFTAGRARNAGFERLLALNPKLEFVQFVDADCEVVEGWPERALRELEARADVAVVCGRRRERFPVRSIYNRIIDIEWNTPVGEAKACGGDAMMRASFFRQVGGFDPQVIAGEEPELCVRLRQRGWKILRVDAEMTIHDAAMTSFWQWWKRATRAGHAFAEGAAMHGTPPERHYLKETVSILLWGFLLPLLSLSLAWPSRGWSLTLIAGYAFLAWRIHRRHRRQMASTEAGLWTLHCVVGKFPMFIGCARYFLSRTTGGHRRLIEYKGSV
jgi:GT2 family glycosyltransferase